MNIINKLWATIINIDNFKNLNQYYNIYYVVCKVPLSIKYYQSTAYKI